MAKVKETLDYALRQSPFYRKARRMYAGKEIRTPSDIHDLPFTGPRDIRDAPFGLLAVSQDKITRVVTLKTSGTTAAPKRIFFTDKDLPLRNRFKTP